MKTRNQPIIWVIGATRSCKTAIAKNGIEPFGFHMISTGDFFREKYAQPDTMSREFVFNISAHAAGVLADNPYCHLSHLEEIIEKQGWPCVVEGERNPIEFARLYDPKQDMVILVKRLDIPEYDTVIERGLKAIEETVKWCVSTGVAPRYSVMRATFGLEEIICEHLGVNNQPDEAFVKGPVKKRVETGEVEDRYPWINIVIKVVRDHIQNYYGLVPVDRALNALPPAPSL